MARPQINICGKITMVAFIILNIFFLLVGLALIAGGSYLVHTGSNLAFFTGNDNYFSGAAIIIAAGCITTIITCVGILGGIFLSRVLLGIYLVAVVLIIVLEIVAGILGFVFRGRVTDQATNIARDALDKYYPRNETDLVDPVINAAIDEIQQDFKCCGWDGPGDWNTTNYFNLTGMFPESCECPELGENCQKQNDTAQQIYSQGCQMGVVRFFRNNLIAAGGVGIAFGLLEILAVLMALGLCACIFKSKDKEYTTV